MSHVFCRAGKDCAGKRRAGKNCVGGAPCRGSALPRKRPAVERPVGERRAGKRCAGERCRSFFMRSLLRRRAQTTQGLSASPPRAHSPVPRDENRSFPRSEYHSAPAQRNSAPAQRKSPVRRNENRPSGAQQKHAPRTMKNSARRATKNVRFLRATNARSAQNPAPARSFFPAGGAGLPEIVLDLVQIEVVLVLPGFLRLGGLVHHVAGGAAAEKRRAYLFFQRVEHLGVFL